MMQSSVPSGIADYYSIAVPCTKTKRFMASVFMIISLGRTDMEHIVSLLGGAWVAREKSP